MMLKKNIREPVLSFLSSQRLLDDKV